MENSSVNHAKVITQDNQTHPLSHSKPVGSRPISDPDMFKWQVRGPQNKRSNPESPAWTLPLDSLKTLNKMFAFKDFKASRRKEKEITKYLFLKEPSKRVELNKQFKGYE